LDNNRIIIVDLYYHVYFYLYLRALEGLEQALKSMFLRVLNEPRVSSSLKRQDFYVTIAMFMNVLVGWFSIAF
jgi:hypothetical protein